MDSNENITPTGSSSRRKFVLGLGILSSFAAVAASLRLPFFYKKDKSAGRAEVKRNMVKMLTKDGTLVEIDASLISSSKRKVSNAELQNWIKK